MRPLIIFAIAMSGFTFSSCSENNPSDPNDIPPATQLSLSIISSEISNGGVIRYGDSVSFHIQKLTGEAPFNWEITSGQSAGTLDLPETRQSSESVQFTSNRNTESEIAVCIKATDRNGKVAKFAFKIRGTTVDTTKSHQSLVWSDEFNGAGSPDPAKWDYEEGKVRNAEAQYYVKNRTQNARVENGNLIIQAIKEPWLGSEYTAASLITKGKAKWTYGRIEVRAKLPSARGTWPAIWMLGDRFPTVPWPKCGELDIMEHVGYDPNVIHGTAHTSAFNHTIGTQVTNHKTVATATSEFHLYSIDWYPDHISWYIDGELYLQFNKIDSSTEKWPFDSPFYLMLNIAVGGTWGGQRGIDVSAFPQQMEIDYVRVYQ